MLIIGFWPIIDFKSRGYASTTPSVKRLIISTTEPGLLMESDYPLKVKTRLDTDDELKHKLKHKK